MPNLKVHPGRVPWNDDDESRPQYSMPAVLGTGYYGPDASKLAEGDIYVAFWKAAREEAHSRE